MPKLRQKLARRLTVVGVKEEQVFSVARRWAGKVSISASGRKRARRLGGVHEFDGKWISVLQGNRMICAGTAGFSDLVFRHSSMTAVTRWRLMMTERRIKVLYNLDAV